MRKAARSWCLHQTSMKNTGCLRMMSGAAVCHYHFSFTHTNTHKSSHIWLHSSLRSLTAAPLDNKLLSFNHAHRTLLKVYSLKTSAGCSTHPNWYLCGVCVIARLLGKSRTLASPELWRLPSNYSLEIAINIAYRDWSTFYVPLQDCTVRSENFHQRSENCWMCCSKRIRIKKAATLSRL